MYDHLHVYVAKDIGLILVTVILSDGQDDIRIQHHRLGCYTSYHSAKPNSVDYRTAKESAQSLQSSPYRDPTLRDTTQDQAQKRNTSPAVQIDRMLCNTRR